MKKIKILLVLVISLTIVSCETQQEVIDTGISNPVFDGTIMDYLRSNDYNWGLTVKIIEKAEITDLFEGQVDTLPEITFLAFTTYSVYNYTFPKWREEQEPTDEDLLGLFSKEEWRELVLKHVFKGKFLKADLPYLDMHYEVFDDEQTGYKEYNSVLGNTIWAYKYKKDYSFLPEKGPEIMGVYSSRARRNIPIATPDIQPRNGVVHAINYDYTLGKI